MSLHRAPISSHLTVSPSWKINSFLSEVLVCWSFTEKITIKIERAFSIILWASPVTRRSFQQSLQSPAVAVTSGNFPTLVSRSHFQVPNWEIVPSHRRSSPVTAWYNYSIIATFEGLKQPEWLKQLLLVSDTVFKIVSSSNCFKLLLHQVSSQPVAQWLLFVW